MITGRLAVANASRASVAQPAQALKSQRVLNVRNVLKSKVVSIKGS